jgi:hypothetical protein
MKKKVRIYKAPDGQGAFLNKTAKFLKKAQEGGMPDPNMMAYPGAQQEQGQTSEDQITQSVVTDISNGRPKEETVVKLVQFMGQDPMQASQYYDQIYAALESQKEQEEEEADEDSENQPIKEEIEQNTATQEIDEDFYGDDTDNDLANEIAAEDDEQDYADDDQVASDIIMQFGGVSPVIVPMRQEGGEAYPIQFPGIEAYLPSNMSDMLSGDVDAFTGQPWSPQAEEEAGVAPDDEVQTDFRNGGQYKKNKRAYVNSVMKLVKKQMGGEDMSKKGDTDPRGEDVRKERLNAFLGTVKNESQMAKAKEQAEQEYDQMMQQQQQMMQQQYPMEQPMAQFGMQMPMRRGLFGRPKMPRGFGFGYGMPPVTKMDVRRTGIFGRPKEYTMEFGMPGVMPGLALPGYGTGFYGYGQTSTIKKGKSPGRIITETVASTVNNASNAEVASNTPNSTATNKPDDKNSSVTNPNSTANNIQVNTATSNKRKGVNVNDELTDAVVNDSNAKRNETQAGNRNWKNVTLKNDAWGRSAGSKWYGYDPKTKIWTKGKPDWAKELDKDDSSNFSRTAFAKAIDYNKIKNTGKDLYRSLPDADKVAKVVGWNKIKNTAGDLYNALPDAPSRQKFVDWGILMDENDPTYKSARGEFSQGGQSYYNPFGGFVDSENPDLYKFVYGGNDPYMTQADIDDVYSKDTSDPYFQDGGGYDDYRKKVGDKLGMSLRDDLSAKELFEMGQKAGIGFGNDATTTTTKKKTTTTQSDDDGYYPSNPGIGYNGFNIFGNLFPASIASYQGSWAKTKRGPYNKATGMMMPGMGFGPNTQVSSIDVKRSGMFGRPKKYTVNFSNQQMDPRKQNLITLPGQGTPGSQGYSGQEPTAQGQSDRFSNTKGLGLGTRAKVAMKELFNRYKDEEEVVPTGDVASTSNEPSPTQAPLSDEDEIAKFQQQQRKNGKRWDEEKQAWVDQEQIKMDLKKPGPIAPSKDIQARMDQEALSREAKQSFGEYGDISTELGDKNVQSEYQKIYETRGKEAAENFMDDQITKRNNNIRTNEAPTSEEQAESARQDIINNENMAANPMFMGRRQPAPEQTPIDQEPINPDAQVKQAPSFEEVTGMQRFNPETGQEEEVVEDEESFGPVANNPFAPTSADDEAAGFGYDINAPQASQKRRSVFNRRSNQQPSRNQSQKSNTPQTKTVFVTENGRKVQKQVPLTKEEKAYYDEEAAYLKEFDRDKRTEAEKKADKIAYEKARVAEREREKREANDPELQKQKRQKEKINEKENAAYKDLYEKPMEELTRQRDLYIKEFKNDPKLTKEQRDRKITQVEQWHQKEEKKLSDKASKQRQWYNEEVNKGKRANFSKKGSGYMSNVKQFGGDLRRFTGGGDSPVTFTDNPALVGMSNVDMISLNEGIPGLGESSLTGFMNTNAPVRDQSQDPKEVKIDKTQISSDQAKKAYQATPGNYSMDFKVKDTWQIDTPAAINTLNAGLRGAAGWIDRFKAKMYDNLTADNLYASDPSLDRGDYSVTGSDYGLYRSPDQGAIHTSRSAQYGGMMYQDGGQRRSFYNTAISDYNQWLANPKAWQEDPEMLAPDGKNLNLCLDCMDMDYSNEQDIRDAHKLIEEGYSTGTHRNEEAFHKGLKQYGLENPVYASKKQLAQNQFGGYYDEEDDDVAYMTEDQIRQFLANGGEIEYL